MIETWGLNHVSLSVRDPEVSLDFYRRLFGVREHHREEGSIQVLGPGPHDVLVFEHRPSHGRPGGIDHFGFRLRDPSHMQHATRLVRELGARILRQGEFSPGYPYLFFEDPDGYTIELWYE